MALYNYIAYQVTLLYKVYSSPGHSALYKYIVHQVTALYKYIAYQVTALYKYIAHQVTLLYTSI